MDDEPQGVPTIGTPAPRRRGSRLVTAVVVISILLIVDLALGALLTGTGVLPPVDRGDVYRLEHAPPSGPTPTAWRDEPWARDFMNELTDFQSAEYKFAPYLQQSSYEFHGDYLNTTDWDRVSYEPQVDTGVEPLRVAFMGGSVVFGIGQRDEHTIPSEFARIAEQSGVPIEVYNFGFPRWVSWQEQLYFERVLTQFGPFDLAIFLDGYNELYVQAEGLSSDPTHHAADAVQALIAEFRDERATVPTASDGWHEMVDSYRRASGFWRVVDRVRGREVPVFASTNVTQGTPEEQADAALGIYARSVGRIDDMADRSGTSVRFYWQPQASGWDPSIIDRLPDEVGDLTHVFDGREGELYFDPVHTNEEGARILAEAMWADVGPALTAASPAR